MDLSNLNKDRKDRRKTSIDLSKLVYGKVPPQAKDLEGAILGAIMLQPAVFDTVAGILKPEMLYVESHQIIFAAMRSLQARNQPTDILMVCEELKKLEQLEMVGGLYFVTTLTNSVVSGANIEAHARIIVQKFIQRELIRISGEIIYDAYEDSTDVFDLLESAETKIMAIGTEHISNDMVGIDDALVKAVKRIEENKAAGKLINGVPTGIKKLDQATRGWQSSDLIILAARPAVGKTAKALKFLRAAVSDGIRKAAFFSLEMEVIQLILRMLAEITDTSLYRLQTGFLTETDLKNLYEKGIKELAKNNVFFDDQPGLTLFKLRSKCRRLKKKHPTLGLIIIDYLQLMESEKRGTREQEVSAISRGLKLLAKELQVAIIALSQLNRGVDGKTGKSREPQLTDLRESGALEQDADVVIMMWGPDDEEILKDASLEGRRYGKIAKQRNGVLLRYEMDFKTSIQRIEQREDLPASGWKKVEEDQPKQQNIFDNKQDLPF